MLSKLKKNTAPGISGIGYVLIKVASPEVQRIFKKFAECCIRRGEILFKWRIAQIYSIPKDQDWGYTLSNIRPIALLETLRKCTTKIFTKRLAGIMVKREVLKGPNFAGLPGGSTETPIQIVNMLIEDAKEKNKEM